MILDLVVKVHYMQNVHQLTFVLMETFYLYIEDGSRIYFDAIVLSDIFCQANLILILDVHKIPAALGIVHINSHLVDLRKVGDPAVANVGSYPFLPAAGFREEGIFSG